MHRWQLMIRCVHCGFQVVVPPKTIHTVDVVGELNLTATRIVNLDPDVRLPPCTCKETK